MAILILTGRFSVQAVFAQSGGGWKDLQQVFKAYAAPISFRGDMKLYPVTDTLHALEELHASFIIGLNGTDCRLGYLETIRTPAYCLTVNNHYKTIFITADKNTNGKAGLFDFTALKRRLKAQSASITADTASEEPVISITFPHDPEVKSYHIFYSPQTYLIDHLSILLIDENASGDTAKRKILKVYYSSYGKPRLTEDHYAEKIVTVQGNRIIPTEKYKNYHIISQL
jgi:hypothetical protein